MDCIIWFGHEALKIDDVIWIVLNLDRRSYLHIWYLQVFLVLDCDSCCPFLRHVMSIFRLFWRLGWRDIPASCQQHPASCKMLHNDTSTWYKYSSNNQNSHLSYLTVEYITISQPPFYTFIMHQITNNNIPTTPSH